MGGGRREAVDIWTSVSLWYSFLRKLPGLTAQCFRQCRYDGRWIYEATVRLGDSVKLEALVQVVSILQDSPFTPCPSVWSNRDCSSSIMDLSEASMRVSSIRNGS